MLNSLLLSSAMLLGQTAPPVFVPHQHGGHERIVVVNGQAPAAGQAAPAVPAEPTKVEVVNGNGNGQPEEEGPWRLFPDPIGGFKVSGWVYGTGNYNPTNGANTRYNGPLTQNDQEGVYLNQFYLSIAKELEDCFSWGARVDLMYGNDYLASQSRGWELRPRRGFVNHWNSGQDYGLAIPQAYVEAGTNQFSIKVGHFWTPIGYMSVPAPSNFFNTLPYGTMATQPFTHWGAIATATPNDNWSGFFGLVNGWDALDRPTDSVAVLGGAKYTFDENRGFFSASFITGQEPENLAGGYSNRTLFNFILGLNFADNWEFVFENNTGWQRNQGLETSWFYSFQPFLFYKINDCLKWGIRYEYFHDPGAFVSGIRLGNPNVGPYNGNFHTVATGLNWAPNGSKNLMIRPEVRYDWFNGNGVPFDAGRDTEQLMLVLGAYVLY